MKTRSVSMSPSFGALKRSPIGMSKEVFDAISQAPAVKKFGEKYDAVLAMDSFISRRDFKRVQYSLKFTDIKPKNIFEKIKNLITGNMENRLILKTHATNIPDFIESINAKHPDAVFRIYNP